MSTPTFATLARDFLAEQYDEHPVRSSGMGLTQYDDLLDDLSGDAFERRAASATSWRERFAAIPDEALTADESIDRDLIVGTPDRAIGLRRVARLGTPPGHLPEPRPCMASSSCSCTSCARSRSWSPAPPRACGRCRPTWRPAGPTCGRSWCRRSCWIGPSTRLGPAPTTPASCCRSRWRRSTRPTLAEAGAEAADAFEAYAEFLESLRPAGARRLGVRRGALQHRPARRRDALVRRPRPARARPPADRGADRPAARRRQGALRLARTGTRCCWSSTRTGRPRRRPCGAATRSGPSARASSCTTRDWSASRPARSARSVPSPPFQRPVLAVASYAAPPSFAETMRGHFFVPVPAGRRQRGGDRQAAGVERLPGHPDHRRARGVSGPPLAPGHGQGQPVARAAAVRDELLRRGLGALRGADDGGERLLRRPAARDVPLRGHPLPGGPDRGRHQPAPGRDDPSGGRRVHDGQLVHDRADRRGRGDALLLVAHPGVARTSPAAWRSCASGTDTWRLAGPMPPTSPPCATSTTPSPAPARCRSPWPSAP